MKILWITASAILIIVISFFLYIYSTKPDFPPNEKTYYELGGGVYVNIIELHSNSNNEKIYIKKKNWGITGDGQVIVISKTPDEEFEPDSTKEYVFEGLLGFFYKFENDTLDLYVRKESFIPNEIFNEIKIKQIELTNPEMMNLTRSYKEKGVKWINER